MDPTDQIIVIKPRRSDQSTVISVRKTLTREDKLAKPKRWGNIQKIETKIDANGPSNILKIYPALNVNFLTFYQPEKKTVNEDGHSVYAIEKFETSSGPLQVHQKPSDIVVRSIKPTRRIKLNKKKRHVSVLSRIENLLNRGPSAIWPPSQDSLVEGNDDDSEEGEREIWTTPKRDINYLPEDVLQKIFLYFTLTERCLILSQVCRSWYFILKNPIFWTSLEFDGAAVQTNVIINLINRCTMLHSLRVTEVPEVTLILQQVCRTNSNIKELYVKFSNLKNRNGARTLHLLVNCCKELQVLDLKGTQFQSKRFFLDLGLLTNLTSLNLSGNEYIQTQDLLTVSINCRQLKVFKLLHRPVEKDARKKLRDCDVSFIMKNLQHTLTTLKLDMYQLGTASYLAILNCDKLEVLVLTNCLLLNGETFRKFPQLKHIKRFKMTRANDILAEDFHFFFHFIGHKKLTHIDVNGCWRIGGTGLYALTNCVPSLEYLSLKNCKSIKGNHLNYLAKCKKLKTLNLAHTAVDSNQLTTLASNAAQLERLIIDQDIYEESSIKALLESSPGLKIDISSSEYYKDERSIREIDVCSF